MKEEDSGLLATWDSPGPREAGSLLLSGLLWHLQAASAEGIALRRVEVDNTQTCLTLNWAAL